MYKLGMPIKYNILYSTESDLAILIDVKVVVVIPSFPLFFK